MKKIFEKYKKSILIITLILILILTNIYIINKNILIFINILFISISLIILFIIEKKNIKNIINDFKAEINNITWINKKELNQTTLIILLILLVTISVLWIIDSTLTYLISKII